MNLQFIKKISIAVLTLFTFLLFIYSCSSHLSNEKIDDISLINTQIEITQNPADKNDNSIVVTLLDKKGYRISNDSLTIFANGIESRLSHRQGLYYTDESKYAWSNVPVSDMYTFEIKLSNGKKYFLGSVQALAEEKPGNIECEETGDIKADYVIKWHDLVDIDELSVFINMKEQTDSNITTVSNKDERIIKVKNTGSYTISKSDYKENKAIISGIEFDFRTIRKGKVNKELLENSSITIKTNIEKYADFERENE